MANYIDPYLNQYLNTGIGQSQEMMAEMARRQQHQALQGLLGAGSKPDPQDNPLLLLLDN